MKNVQETITNKIVEILESGKTLNYNDGFKMVPIGTPQNPQTNTVYRGFNQFFLSLVMMFNGHSLNKWLTFKQVNALGGTIKTGSKGTPIIYYDAYDKKINDPNNPDATERAKFIKSYYVFNVDNIEGLPEDFYKTETVELLQTWEANEKAEQLLQQTGAQIEYRPQNLPNYNLVKDIIYMPEKKQFESDEHFYDCVFHELTHWSGHETRLQRRIQNKFASKDYAFEELIAELSSTFICSHLNIKKSLMNNSAYIENWLLCLKQNKDAIFNAAGKAATAYKYIIQFSEFKTAVAS